MFILIHSLKWAYSVAVSMFGLNCGDQDLNAGNYNKEPSGSNSVFLCAMVVLYHDVLSLTSSLLCLKLRVELMCVCVWNVCV